MFKKTRERIGWWLQKIGNFVQNNIGLPTTVLGATMGVASVLLPVLQPYWLGTTLLWWSLVGWWWITKKTWQVIDTTSHKLKNI